MYRYAHFTSLETDVQQKKYSLLKITRIESHCTHIKTKCEANIQIKRV